MGKGKFSPPGAAPPQCKLVTYTTRSLAPDFLLHQGFYPDLHQSLAQELPPSASHKYTFYIYIYINTKLIVMLSLKTVGFVHIFILHIKIILETPRAVRATLHPGLEGAIGFWGISRAGASQTGLFPKPRRWSCAKKPQGAQLGQFQLLHPHGSHPSQPHSLLQSAVTKGMESQRGQLAARGTQSPQSTCAG